MSRRMGLALLLLALVGGLLPTAVPPVAAQDHPQDRSAESADSQRPPDAQSASNKKSALEIARAHKHPVEAENRRGKKAKTFVRPDGSTFERVFAGTVHVPVTRARRAGGVQGDMEPVDTSLVADQRGLHPVAVDGELRLSRGGRGPVAVFEHDGKAVALSVAGATLNAPAVDGPVATYAGVFPSTDLELEAHGGGFAKRFVLHERPSQAPVYRLRLTLTGLDARLRDDDTIEFLNGDGEVVSEAAPPRMWGAELDEAGEPVRSAAVAMRLLDDDGDYIVELSPDPAFLADASVTLPIRVDPLLTHLVDKDSYVASLDAATSFFYSGSVAVGYNSARGRHRGLVQFNVAPRTNTDQQFGLAHMVLRQYYEHTCAYYQIKAQRLSSAFSSSTTWNNQPGYYSTVVATNNRTECGVGNVSFDGLGAVARTWDSNPTANHGLALLAGNEDDARNRAIYYSSEYGTGIDGPYMDLNFNTRPAVPTAPAPSGVVTSTQPQLSVSLSDSDFDNVSARFKIVKAGTYEAVDHGEGTSVFRNGTSTWTPNVVLEPGVEYLWQAFADDHQAGTADNFTNTNSFSSAYVNLRVNRVPDVPPIISPNNDALLASRRPLLRTRYFDGDGDHGGVDFRVLDSARKIVGPDWHWSGWGPNRDIDFQWPTDLVSGSYIWQTRAWDGKQYSTPQWRDDGTFTINLPPAVPTLLSPADGAIIGATRPTFSARYSDPEGAQGGIDFRVQDNTGTVVGEYYSGDGAPRDVVFTWPVDLAKGTYTWQARASDGRQHSDPPWRDSRTFTIDPDVAPAVTKTVLGQDGQPATTVGKGQAVIYDIVVENPQQREMQVTTVTDRIPEGLAVDVRGVTVDGQRCAQSSTGTPSCTLLDGVLTIAAFPLAAGASKTVTVPAVAVGVDQNCTEVSNLAEAASAAGVNSASANLTICGTGLGLEKWWSVVNADLGPQSLASVNAGNGNLVVQAQDSTAVQAHGRLAYVLRRTYNSSDTTAATLPGSIGAGWQLNVGQSGDLIGDGVSATSLVVPPLESALTPTALTLVDRDGTRHTFEPKSASVTIDVNSVVGASPDSPLAAVQPRHLTAAAGTKLCVDLSYQAPPGVHVSLWRYVQIAEGAQCAAAGSADAVVVGFAAVRPDRLRYEFSADGRLLDMVDGAGVGLRYVYDTSLRLAAVFEPRSCQTTNGTGPLTADAIPTGCRAFRFSYEPFVDNPALVQHVKVADPAGRITDYELDAATPQHLIRVTNPDSNVTDATNPSHVAYTYGGCEGATADQLCSASDPRGNVTSFAYRQVRSEYGPPELHSLTDRRGSATTFTFDAATTTVDQADHRRVFAQIDTDARVGEVTEGDTAGGILRRSTLTWDRDGATCQQPSSNIDNNLCRRVRHDGDTTIERDEDVRYVYNPEGGLLAERWVNAAADIVTTNGYRTQFVAQSGTTHTQDTVAGHGTVVSGSRADAGSALFVLSDRTEALTPRGNAADTAFSDYLTTYTVDVSDTARPHTARTGICGSAATGNSGLVCQQIGPDFTDALGEYTTTDTITRFTYDGFGQRLTVASPKAIAEGTPGKVTRYTYFSDADRDLSATTSAGGWLRAVTDPDGKFVAFGYDAAGNVVRTWDRNATTGKTVGEFPGELATPPSDRFAETLYGPSNMAITNPWRYVRSERDPVGNRSEFTVDSNGNAAVVRPPRGTEAGNGDFDVTQDFDTADNVVFKVSPAGRNAFGDDGWRYTYDAFGNQTAQMDPNGQATVTTYDAVSRNTVTRWTRTADAVKADDSCATVAGVADAPLREGHYICATTTGYDAVDNVVAVTDADGHTTNSTFNAVHRETAREVPRDNNGLAVVRTETVYDADGNAVRVCPPREFTEGTKACTATARYSTHTDYDDAGRATTTTRYRGQQALTTTTAYDADGSAVSVIDARGHTATTRYDLQGRRLSHTIPRNADETNTTKWRYDPAGNVTAVVSPDPTRGDAADTQNNRVSAYSYDANNRVVDAVTAADNQAAADAGFADGEGNHRTRQVYDANGNVTAVYGPRAFSASVTDPDSRFAVRTAYDADDRAVTQWVPRAGGDADIAGPSDDQHAQCPTGQPGYPADVRVCVTKAAYDVAGNRTQLTLPTAGSDTNRVVKWTYTDDYLVEKVEAPSPAANGEQVPAATYRYDASGRAVAVSDALSNTDRSTYTADGLLAARTRQPNGALTHVTRYRYNAAGQETTVVDALDQQAHTTYTTDGLVATSSQPVAAGATSDGNTTKYVYDPVGNPAEVYSPNAVAKAAANLSGTPTVNTYTHDNLLATATVPVSGDGLTRRRTSYGYDDAGRKTSQRVALVDAAGQPTLTGDGGTQRFSYYRNDRLASQTGRATGPAQAEQTITTTYDAAGNTMKVTDSTGGGSTVTATYYLDDLMRSVDQGGRTTRYSYDGAGSTAVRAQTPSGGDTTVTRYGYNDAGLADQAADSRITAGDWTWTYDKAGRATTQTQPHGHTVTQAWNPDGTLRAHTLAAAGGAPVADRSYLYDALYRVKQATLATALGAGGATPVTGNHRFGYDAAGRVASYEDTKGKVNTLTWDPDGNRLTFDQQVFTYNADDTIASATDDDGANRNSYRYHPWGGLASDGCTAYRYDGFDRTAAVGPDSGALVTGAGCATAAPTVTYAYDGLDRQRLTTTTPTVGLPKTTTVAYDGLGSQVLAETDTGDQPKPARGYILGTGGAPVAVTADGATQYLTGDGHGNVSTAVKADGTVACTARFDPFGTPIDPAASDAQGVCNTGDTPNTVFYRGARRDAATGTYQLGSRTYDPAKAAFLTPDSYRTGQPNDDLSVGVDPLTANRYSYVNGDPVNLIDPDGHRPLASTSAKTEKGRDRAASTAHMNGQDPKAAAERYDREHAPKPPEPVAAAATTGGASGAAADPRMQILAPNTELMTDVLLDVLWCLETFCGRSETKCIEMPSGCVEPATGVAPIPGAALRRALTHARNMRHGRNLFAAKAGSETAGGLTNIGRGSARGAGFFDDFSPGQGFSGVYDEATGSMLALPSQYGGNLPAGFVPARGGHGVVNQRLTQAIGSPGGQRAGFTAILETDGSLQVQWLSRSVNGAATPYVPDAVRPGILDALARTSGRTVSG